MRIILKYEQKLNHMEEATPEAPHATVIADVCNAYTRMVNEQQEAEQELFEIVKAFHACKQEEGQFVSTYVLKMKGYLDQMKHLGYLMPLALGVNLILTLLLNDYDQFIWNYNMHSMWKTIPELHAMLKLTEKCIPNKALVVLAIRQSQIQKPKPQDRDKGKGKGKSKLAYSPNQKIPPLVKKSIMLRTQCVITIINLNTRGGTGLRGSQQLNKGVLDLYIGNGNRAAVKAIGSFDLIIPNRMVLVLDNFSKDDLFYFNDIPRDGIFEIEMHSHGLNKRSIYTCSNKKSNGYPKEMMGYYFYYPPENKIFVAQYVEFFESDIILQEASGSIVDFDEIQRQDAQPTKNTSEHQPEDVDPQSDVNPVRRFATIPQAPERYDFYVNVEEHKLGDHGELTK
uniref:Zinc finger, CCHC-type n=1 Tax=Tanacetum cinerariifolium TaxID=118510 RepID=A0A6L2JSX6_TANCI|nr:hypothetical protein [Tanacetum cinerariifolium]